MLKLRRGNVALAAGLTGALAYVVFQVFVVILAAIVHAALTPWTVRPSST